MQKSFLNFHYVTWTFELHIIIIIILLLYYYYIIIIIIILILLRHDFHRIRC